RRALTNGTLSSAIRWRRLRHRVGSPRSHPMSPATTAVASGLTRRQADEVVVLLAAMGIEAVAEADDARVYAVYTGELDAERARALIAEEYPAGFGANVDREQAAARAQRHAPPAGALWLHRDVWAVALVAAVCVGWFWLLHGAGREV